MYTPEIDHAESENRTISACPRKLKSVQRFFIADNRPALLGCSQIMQLDEDEERKIVLREKIIHEIEAIKKLKCLTHDETVLHTLDSMIEGAAQFVEDGSISVMIYQTFTKDIQVFSKNFRQELFIGLQSKIKELHRQYVLMPTYMQNQKNMELIREIFKFDEFATISLENMANIDFRKLEAYLSQFKKLVANSHTVVGRVLHDWESIKGTFQLSSSDILQTIFLTGSDFHNGNESVCILQTMKGRRIVYKPRSIMAEMAISGQEGSFLDNFNQQKVENDHTSPLKTLAFLSGNEEGEGADYGYVECALQAERLTDQEELNYLTQMGEITIISKLLGILDLHQDNIMTLKGGNAAIIDSEVAFWTPYILQLSQWTDSCIHMCLFNFIDEKQKVTVNFYLTDSDWKYIKKEFPKHKDNQQNSAMAIQERHRERLCKEGNPCRTAFLNGIELGLAKLRKLGRQNFETWIDRHLDSIGRVRIVPLETSEFQRMRDYYRMDRKKYDTNLPSRITAIFRYFQNAACRLLMPSSELEKFMGQDFERGDIPIFYFDLANNTVIYHDKVVANMPFRLKHAMLNAFDYLTHYPLDILQAEIMQTFLN